MLILAVDWQSAGKRSQRKNRDISSKNTGKVWFLFKCKLTTEAVLLLGVEVNKRPGRGTVHRADVHSIIEEPAKTGSDMVESLREKPLVLAGPENRARWPNRPFKLSICHMGRETCPRGGATSWNCILDNARH